MISFDDVYVIEFCCYSLVFKYKHMPEPGAMAEKSVVINSIFNVEKPAVVIRNPDSGKVEAVGGTVEEAEARKARLGEVPTSISDPATGADTVNPEWIKARAESYGLTPEEYRGLVEAGVMDIGEFVAGGGKPEGLFPVGKITNGEVNIVEPTPQQIQDGANKVAFERFNAENERIRKERLAAGDEALEKWEAGIKAAFAGVGGKSVVEEKK